MAGVGDDDGLEVRIPRMARLEVGGNSRKPEPERSVSKPGGTKGGYGTPKVKDWFVCALELRTALEAGVSFLEAVALVGENSSSRTVKRALQHVLMLVREGMGVEKVFTQCTDVPPLMRNLMVVGLRGGSVVTALNQIVRHYEWVLEMRGRILRAIVYPAALVVLGAFVMTGRDSVIAGMKGVMPASHAAAHYGLKYFLPIALGAVVAMMLAWVVRVPLVRPIFDRVILTAPVIGKMVHRYAVATFLRSLAVLIQAGMPITSAWALAAQCAGNHHIAQRLQAGMRFLQDGESVHEAMRITGILDSGAIGMARAGGESGSVTDLLLRHAGYCEDGLKTLFRGLSTMIGPFCLGGIVLGYFVNPWWLGVMAFLLMLARRMI